MQLTARIHVLIALVPAVMAQSYLFAFGDSYTATGFDPNGVQPSPNNPIGNPYWNYSLSYQNVQGSVAGGPDYVDWIVTQYNGTTVQAYNFAYPGATINNSVATRNGPPDLLTQISSSFMPKYSTQGNSVAPWSATNSLFMLCFGINDIDLSWSSVPASTQVPKLISSYFNALNQLYQDGARNFLILNVPPFDRSPYEVRGGSGATTTIASYIQQFNAALASNATAFASSHSGAQVKLYDYNTFMSNVLNSPNSYGFTSATCEGAGYSQCIWWQNTDLHTTSVFQRNLARDLANSGLLGSFGKTGNPSVPLATVPSKSVSAFCPVDDTANYTTASGDIYNIRCQFAFAFSTLLEQSQQTDLQACLLHCSQWNLQNSQKCLGANFYQPGGTCYLKNNTGEQSFYDVDSGLLVSPPSQATGAASLTSSSASAATSASSAEPNSTCPGANSTQVTGVHSGRTFTFLCNYDVQGSTDYADDYHYYDAQCFDICDSSSQCIAVAAIELGTYVHCYYKKQNPSASLYTLSQSTVNAYYISASPTTVPSASSTSTLTSSTATAEPNSTCPGANGTQVIGIHSSRTFTFLCGYDVQGTTDYANDYHYYDSQCFDICDSSTQCLAVAAIEMGTYVHCYYKQTNPSSTPTALSNPGVNAYYIPVGSTASSTSAMATASPSAEPNSTCPGSNGTQVIGIHSGRVFSFFCGYDVQGTVDFADDYHYYDSQCFDVCDSNPQCLAVSAIEFGTYVHCYYKEAKPSSAPYTLPSSGVNSYSLATVSTANCPDDNGKAFLDNDGIEYQVLCGQNWDGSLLLDSTYTSDLASCLLHCSDYNKQAGKTVCLGATFYPQESNCWTVNATTQKHPNSAYNSGLRISA